MNGSSHVGPCSASAETRKGDRILECKRPCPLFGFNALVLMVIAAGWAGYHAWAVQQARTEPLDLDGWGWLVHVIRASDHSFAALFSEPSLWKGPIVPFLFGLAYYLVPWEEAVLGFNVMVFALSAGLLFTGFLRLQASCLAANAAILLWILYLPHAFLFGYYYAEPVLALLVAMLFTAVASAIRRQSLPRTFLAGAIGGVLLLARAPYILVILSFGVLLWHQMGESRGKAVLSYFFGLVLTFSPWMVRNFIEYRELIPFTTEGGKILFMSTYLPADDARTYDFRAIAEFRELEKAEQGLTAIEQYHYWRRLAVEQIRQDPAGQAALCIRKCLRFWVYLPAYSWAPTWKTAFAAALFLPLAAFAFLVKRDMLLVKMCAICVIGLWLFHCLLHSELRYNFPILPYVFLLASMGAQTIWTQTWCLPSKRQVS